MMRDIQGQPPLQAREPATTTMQYTQAPRPKVGSTQTTGPDYPRALKVLAHSTPAVRSQAILNRGPLATCEYSPALV